jgi:hypothetical protein
VIVVLLFTSGETFELISDLRFRYGGHINGVSNDPAELGPFQFPVTGDLSLSVSRGEAFADRKEPRWTADPCEEVVEHSERGISVHGGFPLRFCNCRELRNLKNISGKVQGVLTNAFSCCILIRVSYNTYLNE